MTPVQRAQMFAERNLELEQLGEELGNVETQAATLNRYQNVLRAADAPVFVVLSKASALYQARASILAAHTKFVGHIAHWCAPSSSPSVTGLDTAADTGLNFVNQSGVNHAKHKSPALSGGKPVSQRELTSVKRIDQLCLQSMGAIIKHALEVASNAGHQFGANGRSMVSSAQREVASVMKAAHALREEANMEGRLPFILKLTRANLTLPNGRK